MDTWHGVRFSYDYSRCDAVALVIVSGAYDEFRMPDGSLGISVGLTNKGQHVQVNVDGTYQHCG